MKHSTLMCFKIQCGFLKSHFKE